jgi:hypothetical protein
MSCLAATTVEVEIIQFSFTAATISACLSATSSTQIEVALSAGQALARMQDNNWIPREAGPEVAAAHMVVQSVPT